MKENTLLLGLHARTSIAAGTGQNLGAVDLPIMREAPTGYPVIFGSAFKGALRAQIELESGADAAKVYFGDDSAGGSQYAGAVIVSDARLLLLPVRSMTTHFRWVTCPYILERYLADRHMLGDATKVEIPRPAEGEAIMAEGEGKIFLEEFQFDIRTHNLDPLMALLVDVMDGEHVSALKKQLAIVSDDLFAHMSRYATPVNAHIAIDNATKTVKNGALWYEESLPPETILYSLLIANASRKEGDTHAQASIIKEQIKTDLDTNDYLQVGGNETVGMGWCKVVCHG